MLALIFLFVVAVEAQEKRIRLRNEVITTPAPAKLPPARQGLVSEPPVSGLYLVQFDEAISPAGREQLRAIGVALLRYVPDDAFVARLDNVDLSQLRALPFVRWAGAYRADHKIHSALRAVGPVQRADDRQAVSVLFSTAAQPAEIAEALRQFQGVPRQARGRFGDVLRGSVERGRLQILAGSPAVLWIEPAPKIRLFDEVAADIVAGDGGTHTTFAQAEGYDGAGVTVAVADSVGRYVVRRRSKSAATRDRIVSPVWRGFCTMLKKPTVVRIHIGLGGSRRIAGGVRRPAGTPTRALPG